MSQSQRNSDQEPEEGDGQPDVRVRGRNKGENKPRRRGEEGGDNRGGERGNRRGERREGPYSVGGGPGPTAFAEAFRKAGVIPGSEKVNLPPAEHEDHRVPRAPATVEPTTKHPVPPIVVAEEITPPASAEVAPTPAPVSAGPTPEPISTVTHKEETTMTAPEGLPSLDIKPLTVEEIEKAAAEAAGRRTWAEAAGKSLTQLRTDKATIEASTDFAMSPTLKARHAQIVAQINQIEGVQDEGVKKHAEFSELFNAITSATTDQVQDMIDRALKAGRIKAVPDARGTKVLYWHGKSYVAATGTGGNDAMIVELIKLANKAKDENRDRWNAGVAAMKEKGSGLTLLAAGEGEPGDPAPVGMVYVHLPRTDGRNNETGEKFVIPESHMLLEVAKIEGKGRDDKSFTQYVIRPIQAMGGGRKREELFDTMARTKAYMSVRDFRYGNLPRSLKERIPAEAYENLRRFMGLLRAALEIERAAANKVAEAAKATAAPAVVVTEAPAGYSSEELAALGNNVTQSDLPADAPEATTGETAEVTPVEGTAEVGKPVTPRKRVKKTPAAE